MAGGREREREGEGESFGWIGMKLAYITDQEKVREMCGGWRSAVDCGWRVDVAMEIEEEDGWSSYEAGDVKSWK